MPSILEQLAKDQARRGICRLCRWIADRPDDEQRQWDVAVGDPNRYTHASISRLVNRLDKEADVSQTIVMNHRTKGHRTAR